MLTWVYTNTPTWELIGTVTWVYTNTRTRELNRYGRTRPDQTHFKSFLSIDVEQLQLVNTVLGYNFLFNICRKLKGEG